MHTFIKVQKLCVHLVRIKPLLHSVGEFAHNDSLDQQSRAAGLWSGRGLEGSISLVEPDAVILGIFGDKNIRLAVAVEIPNG